MSLTAEIWLVWSAVMVYSASTVLYISGTVFAAKRVLLFALVTASTGLALQAASFAIRWVRVGHAPYLGFYEVVAGYAFATVASVVFLAGGDRQLRPLGRCSCRCRCSPWGGDARRQVRRAVRWHARELVAHRTRRVRQALVLVVHRGVRARGGVPAAGARCGAPAGARPRQAARARRPR